MTIDSSDRWELIRYRLEPANETIEDVRILIEYNRFRAAVNRIFYGMFYSLLVSGIKSDFETSKHAQLKGN
jgi:uncharacterized protein (UPF0332 family)